jgi:hypothetical protein
MVLEKEILEELKKQNRMLSALTINQLRITAAKELASDIEKKVYAISDGANSTNDVSKILLDQGIKLSGMTVFNYWRRWAEVGLVVPSENYEGRFEKVFDLYLNKAVSQKPQLAKQRTGASEDKETDEKSVDVKEEVIENGRE